MKKILLISFFLLSACVENNLKNDINNESNFSLNMSIQEFKSELDKYAINNPYPKIDD
tara:strand:+ start:755 stop:928 length:174 start_codon:yes stop_codon:yes gene_type:complete